jgi:hypothetical protein
MMCVALWPFAWIIFGLLTSSFFAAWIKCMAGVGIWDGAKLTTVLMDDVATNISSGEIIDAMSSGQQMVQNITMTGLGPLLALTLGTAFLALWLIFAPFKLAFWFQDMLISGANKVMDGALSGAKGAAKLAATAGGGVVAGSGAVLARGGGSALTQKIMGSEGAKAFGRMASAAGEAMGEAAQTGEKSSREGTSKASADMAAAAYKVFRAASAKASN